MTKDEFLSIIKKELEEIEKKLKQKEKLVDIQKNEDVKQFLKHEIMTLRHKRNIIKQYVDLPAYLRIHNMSDSEIEETRKKEIQKLADEIKKHEENLASIQNNLVNSEKELNSLLEKEQHTNEEIERINYLQNMLYSYKYNDIINDSNIQIQKLREEQDKIKKSTPEEIKKRLTEQISEKDFFDKIIQNKNIQEIIKNTEKNKKLSELLERYMTLLRHLDSIYMPGNIHGQFNRNVKGDLIKGYTIDDSIEPRESTFSPEELYDTAIKLRPSGYYNLEDIIKDEREYIKECKENDEEFKHLNSFCYKINNAHVIGEFLINRNFKMDNTRDIVYNDPKFNRHIAEYFTYDQVFNDHKTIEEIKDDILKLERKVISPSFLKDNIENLSLLIHDLNRESQQLNYLTHEQSKWTTKIFFAKKNKEKIIKQHEIIKNYENKIIKRYETLSLNILNWFAQTINYSKYEFDFNATFDTDLNFLDPETLSKIYEKTKNNKAVNEYIGASPFIILAANVKARIKNDKRYNVVINEINEVMNEITKLNNNTYNISSIEKATNDINREGFSPWSNVNFDAKPLTEEVEENRIIGKLLLEIQQKTIYNEMTALNEKQNVQEESSKNNEDIQELKELRQDLLEATANNKNNQTQEEVTSTSIKR